MTAAMLDAEALALTGSRPKLTSVMLVGFGRQSMLRLAPALDREEVQLVEVNDPFEALATCAGQRFDLLVVRHPIGGVSVDRFLNRLRRPGGRSHRAYALILTEGVLDRSLEKLQGTRSRFVNTTDFDTILAVISQNGLGVAPRIEARVTVRLGLQLSGEKMTRFCQVRNLSESGMLVRIAERPEIGSRVEMLLNLPNVRSPIELRGLVVRHTGRREVEGIALRFVDLDRETRGHLRRYIATQIDS